MTLLHIKLLHINFSANKLCYVKILFLINFVTINFEIIIFVTAPGKERKYGQMEKQTLRKNIFYSRGSNFFLSAKAAYHNEINKLNCPPPAGLAD
jgi:hypothetical protein